MKDDISVFEKTYRHYLASIADLDLRDAVDKLGIVRLADESLQIPLFGEKHSVSPTGVTDASGNEPSHRVKVVLCQYVLYSVQVTGSVSTGDWVSYRDFKDSAPLVGAFRNNAERPVAHKFSGRVEELCRACKEQGGYPADGPTNYDLSMLFQALPRISILLVFSDADEEFPADCRQLFESGAEKFLDPESLAILGWLLADHLIKRAPGNREPD